jgi:hypothetical protein
VDRIPEGKRCDYSPVVVEAAQICDVVSEPVVLFRILRDGVSGELRDAGHAET